MIRQVLEQAYRDGNPNAEFALLDLTVLEQGSTIRLQNDEGHEIASIQLRFGERQEWIAPKPFFAVLVASVSIEPNEPPSALRLAD